MSLPYAYRATENGFQNYNVSDLVSEYVLKSRMDNPAVELDWSNMYITPGFLVALFSALQSTAKSGKNLLINLSNNHCESISDHQMQTVLRSLNTESMSDVSVRFGSEIIFPILASALKAANMGHLYGTRIQWDSPTKAIEKLAEAHLDLTKTLNKTLGIITSLGTVNEEKHDKMNTSVIEKFEKQLEVNKKQLEVNKTLHNAQANMFRLQEYELQARLFQDLDQVYDEVVEPVSGRERIKLIASDGLIRVEWDGMFICSTDEQQGTDEMDASSSAPHRTLVLLEAKNDTNNDKVKDMEKRVRQTGRFLTEIKQGLHDQPTMQNSNTAKKLQKQLKWIKKHELWTCSIAGVMSGHGLSLEERQRAREKGLHLVVAAGDRYNIEPSILADGLQTIM